MNLVYAQVVSVSSEHGCPVGKVSVWGVMKTVPFDLVPEARSGDTVLLCDGVAIGVASAEHDPFVVEGNKHVSGNPR